MKTFGLLVFLAFAILLVGIATRSWGQSAPNQNILEDIMTVNTATRSILNDVNSMMTESQKSVTAANSRNEWWENCAKSNECLDWLKMGIATGAPK